MKLGQNKSPAPERYSISGPADAVTKIAEIEARREIEREDGARWPCPEGSPKYIKACAEERWYLALWPRATPGQSVMIVPYRCKSRRHPGPCRDAWAQRLYKRIEQGHMLASTDPCALVTFTLPAEWHRRRTVSAMVAANEKISRSVGAWTDAMNMSAKRAGLAKLAYVWAREDHKSGVPHVHLLLSHPFADECDPWVRGGVPAPSLWQKRALAVGLGRLDASRVHSQHATRSYITKLLSEATKNRQRSIVGALHRRDFGASEGFLASVPRDESLTGALLNRRGAPVNGHGIPRMDADWLFTLDFTGR